MNILSEVTDIPLPLSILTTTFVEAAIAATAKGIAQKFPSLWCGLGVVDWYRISPCQPLFIAFWLVFPDKNIH